MQVYLFSVSLVTLGETLEEKIFAIWTGLPVSYRQTWLFVDYRISKIDVTVISSMFIVLSSGILEPSEEMGKYRGILEREMGGNQILEVLDLTRLCLPYWKILPRSGF